jgi:hypothetical protein
MEIIDEILIKENGMKDMTICSDGGGKDGKGSVWTVVSKQNKIVIRLTTRVPEGYNNMRSYRRERFGIL